MSHHESEARGADARLVDRMLFFSDAVFAIVLTLLALELRAPPVTLQGEQALSNAIAALGVNFAAFAISFALGAAFWLAHIRTSRMLLRWDWLTAFVNLFHLLTVGLLPFAGALLGEHIASSIAFTVYGIIIIMVSFTGGLLWLTATRDKGRLVGGMNARQRIAGFIRTTAIGWAFIVGVLASTIWDYPNYARFCWLLLFPLLTLARIIAGRSLKQS